MSLQKNKVFFVYVDRTVDEDRTFYVGKGIKERLRRRARNAYWKNIVAKHGWDLNHREIVLATKDESFAFEEEKRRISELGTFEDGTPGRWGANLTDGGEGTCGHIMLESSLAKRSGCNHPFFGKKRPEEVAVKTRGEKNGFYGKTHSNEWKRHKSLITSGENHLNFGKHLSQETRNKIGAANSKPNPMLQGENHPNATLTSEQVQELCSRYEATRHLPHSDPTRMSYSKLAVQYGISTGHAANIVAGRYWRKS